MQWFVVKYRKSDGTMTEAEFEAADKSALFKILAEKKISAINIQPGRLSKRSSGRRSVAKRTSRGSSAGLVLGILAVVAVAVAAFVVWFMFFRSASESRTGKPIKKISRTVRTPPVKERPQPSTSNVVEQALPVPTPPPVGNVMTARTAKTGRVMTLMDGTVVTNVVERPFKRDLEHALWVALRPGNMGAGLLTTLQSRYSEREIIQMLKDTTLPEAGDSEGLLRIKSEVQGLKDRILDELESGRSLSDVFNEIRNQGVKESIVKAETMRLRAEAIRSGDAQNVREVIKRVNEIRAQHGLSALDVPEEFRAETPHGGTFSDFDDGENITRPKDEPIEERNN